jgi:hypothetical protein
MGRLRRIFLVGGPVLQAAPLFAPIFAGLLGIQAL